MHDLQQIHPGGRLARPNHPALARQGNTRTGTTTSAGFPACGIDSIGYRFDTYSKRTIIRGERRRSIPEQGGYDHSENHTISQLIVVFSRR
jgi:hypothetical protein